MARPLCRLGAMLGFRVTVLDDRPVARPHFRHFVPQTGAWRGVTMRALPVSYTPPELAALYKFPPASEQATKWLGKDGVATKALKATADFQLSQKQVEKTLPDYGVAVNPSYAQAAAK